MVFKSRMPRRRRAANKLMAGAQSLEERRVLSGLPVTVEPVVSSLLLPAVQKFHGGDQQPPIVQGTVSSELGSVAVSSPQSDPAAFLLPAVQKLQSSPQPSAPDNGRSHFTAYDVGISHLMATDAVFAESVQHASHSDEIGGEWFKGNVMFGNCLANASIDDSV